MGEDDKGDAGDRWVRASPSGGLRGARAVRTLPGSFSAGTVALSPDGRLGVCGGAREPVRLWELATGTLLREIGTRGAGAAGVATDGRWVLASGKGSLTKCTLTGRAGRFDTRQLPRIPRHPTYPRRPGVVSDSGAVAFNATGRFALGICADHTLWMWDLADGSHTRTLTGHAVWPTAVWLGPDSRRAVSAGSDAEIRVWDVDSGECAVFPHPGSWVSSVCLSADGRLVLAAGHHQGRTLWLLDAGTGDFVRAFEDVRDSRSMKDPGDRSGEVLTARFTSDGRFAVSGEDDGRIRIWETATGRHVRTLVGHTDEVYGIALTPDDRLLLSGSLDSTLQLWELDW
ncbi:WD40 repeat domain-containing protein [Streptomyces sp. NPDC127132]|uniref:WD40 repeat domain-containing protein n=1 Tax=Streptomyces sp. NPDC127132 TaxID=3345374 RepID=UPI00363BF3FE